MKRALRSTLAILTVTVLAATAGCGGKKEDKGPTATGKPATTAEAGAGGCDELGQRSVAQSMDQTPPGMTPDQVKALRAMSEEAGKVIAARCKADAWSPEAIACGLKAKNPAVECDATLTAEQKQKMIAEVQAIFQKGSAALMPATPPPPPPPPAPLAPAN